MWQFIRSSQGIFLICSGLVKLGDNRVQTRVVHLFWNCSFSFLGLPHEEETCCQKGSEPITAWEIWQDTTRRKAIVFYNWEIISKPPIRWGIFAAFFRMCNICVLASTSFSIFPKLDHVFNYGKLCILLLLRICCALGERIVFIYVDAFS